MAVYIYIRTYVNDCCHWADFPKTQITGQCFVKNGCTEYYENPTDGLTDDAGSTAEWVDGGTDRVCT